MSKDRTVHVIAIDQTITTADGIIPNMDIRMWAIKTADDTIHLGILHKLASDLYRMDSDWFGQLYFENLVDARDYVQEELDNIKIN